MTIKYFVPSAVTGLLLSAVVGVAPAAAQRSTALVADSSFMQAAASLGLLQEKLGKVAQEKASSTAVQEFGRQMLTDYKKSNQELKEAAEQAAFPRPVLMREHAQLADRYIRMSRSSFDKAYMAEVVNIHNEAVRLFQHEAESGKVASLKQLASRMLPELQQRLKVAVETASSVGADVTASSSEAKAESGS
jgi:putative membrane protein